MMFVDLVRSIAFPPVGITSSYLNHELQQGLERKRDRIHRKERQKHPGRAPAPIGSAFHPIPVSVFRPATTVPIKFARFENFDGRLLDMLCKERFCHTYYWQCSNSENEEPVCIASFSRISISQSHSQCTENGKYTDMDVRIAVSCKSDRYAHYLDDKTVPFLPCGIDLTQCVYPFITDREIDVLVCLGEAIAHMDQQFYSFSGRKSPEREFCDYLHEHVENFHRRVIFELMEQEEVIGMLHHFVQNNNGGDRKKQRNTAIMVGACLHRVFLAPHALFRKSVWSLGTCKFMKEDWVVQAVYCWILWKRYRLFWPVLEWYCPTAHVRDVASSRFVLHWELLMYCRPTLKRIMEQN